MAHAIYHAPSPGLLRLIFAEGFYNIETQQLHHYPKTKLERFGGYLRLGLGSFVNFALRYYNNPIVII